MDSLATLYLKKYGLQDNENEEKRVRELLRKIHEKDSVFCDFPFDYLNSNEQLIILHYIMTSLPERQIMANMKKIDVDRNYLNFIYEDENNRKETEYLLENELSGYSPIQLVGEVEHSRDIIRNPYNNISEVIKQLQRRNKLIIQFYLKENRSFNMIGLELYNFNYIREYIDYVSNVILQLLVYRVITQENVKTSDIVQILSKKIDEMEKLVEKKLEERKNDWINKDIYKKRLDAEFVTNCFSTYVTHRSRFYEEFTIKDILKKEMLNEPTLFGKIQSKYTAKKIFINKEQLDNYKAIITEGQDVNDFSSKIEVVQEFISLMATYGGRDCWPLCLQDLKVYFREIFISKVSYKRRMASRIVKEYISQVKEAKKNGQSIPQFNKQSQYMFVREKINRGYFREKGLSEEYIEKINIEKKLYDLQLKLYLFYDIESSLNFIWEINDNLLKVYYSELLE